MTPPEVQCPCGALRDAAAWLAESLGYPFNMTTATPPPAALWEALVDHVHADESGKWHGNELDRDEVEGWLTFEGGLPGTGSP